MVPITGFAAHFAVCEARTKPCTNCNPKSHRGIVLQKTEMIVKCTLFNILFNALIIINDNGHYVDQSQLAWLQGFSRIGCALMSELSKVKFLSILNIIVMTWTRLFHLSSLKNAINTFKPISQNA